MPGKILEMKSLIPTEATGSSDAKQITKAEALKAFRDSKPGAQKKEDVLSALEEKIKLVDEMTSNKDEYEVVAKSEEDAKDPLADLTGGTNVVMSSNARRKFEDLIAVLTEDLSNSPTKSKATVYKEEASGVVGELFKLLGLRSEDSEDQLKPVQEDARRLLEQAINSGSKAGIEQSDVYTIVGMMSGDASKSISATVDLINSIGLDKLIKKDSGFISKLKRSYGKLGGALATFVQNKVLALTTRPIDTLTESQVEPEVRDAVKAFKQDLFSRVSEKAIEDFDKKSKSLLKGYNPDNYIPELLEKAQALFVADAEDTAKSAAREFVAHIMSKTREVSNARKTEETSKAVSSELKEAISKGKKESPRSVIVNKDLIEGDVLRTAWFKDIAQAAREFSVGTLPIVTKDKVAKILKELKDAKTLNINKYVTGITIDSLSQTQLDQLYSSVSEAKDETSISGFSDGKTIKATKPDGSNAELTLQDIYKLVKAKIQENVNKSFESQQQRANEINQATLAFTDLDKADPATVDKVLAKEEEWHLVLNGDAIVKDTASKLLTSIDSKAKAAKKEAQDTERFLEVVNGSVMAPIMSKASTISKTILHALGHSMIDSDSNIDEEFKAAFEAISSTAKTRIENKKSQQQAKLDALKHTLMQKAKRQLEEINSALPTTDINNLISVYLENVEKLNSDVKTQLGVASLTDTQKTLLDTSEDPYLTPFDLTKKQLERTKLFGEKILVLQKAKLDKAGDKKTDLQALVARASFITKEKVEKARNSLATLKTDFDKVDSMDKELSRFESLAKEDDVWELATGTNEDKGLVKGILDDMINQVKYGLKAILRSAGLYHEDNMKILSSRLEKADADSELQGMPAILRTALTGMMQSKSSSTATAA